MPEPLQYAVSAEDAAFHQTLADGSIRIDIRPLGWRRALNINSRLTAVAGVFFALLGLCLPLGVIAYRYWVRRDAEMLGMLLLAVMAEAAVVAVVVLVFRHRARRHVELTAGPAGLTWWASGPMDPRNKHWPREMIADLDVCEVTHYDGESSHPKAYCLKLRLREGSYELISDRPKEQLETVAALCRRGLGLNAS